MVSWRATFHLERKPDLGVRHCDRELVCVDRTEFPQRAIQGDWPRWRTFRRMRAKSSHTYDEEIALEVVAAIPDYLDEARFLFAELEKVQR